MFPFIETPILVGLCVLRLVLSRGFLFFVLCIGAWITYAYAYIPLRNIPGTWKSRLFPLQKRQNRLIDGKHVQQLHQKYGICLRRSCFDLGPIVRIGPNIMSVQGTDAIQAMYGPSSKWKKPSLAPCGGISQTTHHGVLQVSPTLDDIECRKLLEPCFSSEAITKQQHVILNCSDTALTVTEIACENGEGKVDILQIARTYAFDVISIGLLECANVQRR
jgi:hypothetical protein